jgi:arylsulfatase A-like enzyme
LAGAKSAIPATADGVSFVPTLLGKPQEPRSYLYREFHGYGGQQSVRVGDWKLLKRHLLPKAKNPVAPTVELYDLAADPTESKNVAGAHPDLVARLEKLMREQHVPSREFSFPCLDEPSRKKPAG